MGQYRVNREFYTDTARFEPGESDLEGLGEADKAAVIANGWVTLLGDDERGAMNDETSAPVEEPPLALTHYEGTGEPPDGTWENYWQQQAASNGTPAEASPRKRRKNEE